MAMKKGVKIAIPVVVIAVVVIVVLGYFGYLPFLNSPHYGFPSSQQMSNAAGNGKTYNQTGSPTQQSGSSSNYSGASSYEMLDYSSGITTESSIIVIEVQFSSSSDAQSAYAELSGNAAILAAHLSVTVSSNASYRGFTYFYYNYSGIEIGVGYDSSYIFVVTAIDGSAGSISITATSHAVIDAMY